MDLVNIELTREECEAIREQDGYERGLTDEQRKIAKNMKDMSIDIEIISEVTGMSPEEIQGL